MARKESGRKRRVYYATDDLHRKTKIAASLLGEDCTEFVNNAIRERIESRFPPEQQAMFFHSSLTN